MTYKFSKTSLDRLQTCHPFLQDIMNVLIQVMDVTILEGHRGEKRQNEMVHQGLSQLMWPNSKHNSKPSMAVDVAPYPIDWNDRERFVYMAGIIFGIAQSLGYPIRWGGDFDMDGNLRNNNFYDLPHFELVTK